jgi:membrane-associated phospholipid phosphatase
MAAPPSAPDRTALHVALAGVLFLGTVVLTVFVHGLTGLDNTIREWVIQRRSDGWTTTLTVISTLGSSLILAPIAVVVALVLRMRGHRSDALLVSATTLGALVLGPLLKTVIERPRPTGDHVVQVNSWAYPSGHSLTSMAVLGVLTVLAVRHIRLLAARAAATATGVLLIAAVGVSRVYLGVHWPTDVLAGWLIGSMLLALCLILFGGRRAAPR